MVIPVRLQDIVNFGTYGLNDKWFITTTNKKILHMIFWTVCLAFVK
jgi:hypothetical protein